MKTIILDGFTTTHNDEGLNWDAVAALGDVEVYDRTDPADVVPRCKGADAVFTNKVRLDADTIAQLPDLKYIGIIATGTDTVDLKAAKDRGIVVTNIPVYANYSVPQLTFALILELCYGIRTHSDSITEDRHWCNQPYNSYWLQPLIGLEGKTLGVVGMGRIGYTTAQIGQAFGMNILAHDIYERELPGVTWVTLNDLLEKSDFVTLNCPLTEESRHLIDKAALSKMKNTAYLINTSRGPLVNDEDLADALNNGVIAGAGLDVLQSEPPSVDNPLLSAKNVVITPHIGWATLDARKKLIGIAADNLAAFIDGKPVNVVNG